MAWKGLAAPQYNRQRKKLSPGVLKVLNRVQAQVLQDPHRGDRKRGPLKDVWVEKFKAENDQWLLAYMIQEKQDTIHFIAIGQHENFYRDITRHLEARTGSDEGVG